MIRKQTISGSIFLLLILSIALNFLDLFIENTKFIEVLKIIKIISLLLLMILIVVFQPRWIYWWRTKEHNIKVRNDINKFSLVFKIVLLCSICFSVLIILSMVFYFLFF